MSFSLELVFLVANIVTRGSAAVSNYQTCYKIDGSVLDGSFRCDNGTTGHSACCSPGEVCWSNGVCQAVTHGVQDWLREGCTDHTWNDLACFDVCPWILGKPDVGRTAAGVRPCDGINIGITYCCDNGTTGLGSFACCNDKAQTFMYNNLTTLPTVLATIPVINDLATTTQAVPINATVTITDGIPGTTGEGPVVTGASLTESTSSPADSNDSATSIALGAGLGAGLPVAAAIIGGIWLTIWRSKQKQLQSEKGSQQHISGASLGLSDGTLGPPISHELAPDDVKPELPSGYESRELPA
ncbi:hypothetical protein F5Y04DRAFT_278853 [Hypomontagnella monticulosa]|nr:hypothetical protein F5Y04DRAFT_278853 [Hypomontagnella monticulosa]